MLISYSRVGLVGVLVARGNRTGFRGLTQFFLQTCLLIHVSAHYRFRRRLYLRPSPLIFLQEGVLGNLTFDKKWGFPQIPYPFIHSPLPHPRLRFRKLRSRPRPSVVRIDSGWNWTPYTARSRWRNPMISPTAVCADTIRVSGRLSRSTMREW